MSYTVVPEIAAAELHLSCLRGEAEMIVLLKGTHPEPPYTWRTDCPNRERGHEWLGAVSPGRRTILLDLAS